VSHPHYPAFLRGDAVAIDHRFDFFVRRLNRLTIACGCVGMLSITADDFFGGVWRAKSVAALRSRE
jgi:hypothetical protein